MVCSWCEKKGFLVQHTILRCQSKEAGELSASQKREIEREKDENLKKLQTRVDELEKNVKQHMSIIDELANKLAPKVLPHVPNKIHLCIKQNDPKKPDIKVIVKKLELGIQEKIISELEKATREIFKKYEIDDPSDIILDKLTNKFPQEKFEHSNGRVNISDMSTVLTTKYISNLFTGDVKDNIRSDFTKILRSFKKYDGFE